MPPAPGRSIAARWGQFLLGMACLGLSVSLMIRSGLGLGPWDAFHTGLAGIAGITIGQASVVVGLAVLLVAVGMGLRPGMGTVANIILIGAVVDVVLPFLPAATSLPGPVPLWQGGYFAVGIVGMGFGTGMYIGSALGAGPRDGLMVVLSARFRWPVRRVRTLLEASVLAGGWLMGGKLGIGTVAFMVGIGPATQWGMQHFGLVARGGSAKDSTLRPGARAHGPPDTGTRAA